MQNFDVAGRVTALMGNNYVAITSLCVASCRKSAFIPLVCGSPSVTSQGIRGIVN